MPVIGVDSCNFTFSASSIPREQVATFLATLAGPVFLAPTTTRGVVSLVLLEELIGERRAAMQRQLDNQISGLSESAPGADTDRVLLEFDEESHLFSLGGVRLWAERYGIFLGWNIGRGITRRGPNGGSTSWAAVAGLPGGLRHSAGSPSTGNPPTPGNFFEPTGDGQIVQFVKALRDRIRRGEITCSVRLWQRPHVRVGGRYSLPPGEILVTSLLEISLADVTPDLARKSGFAGVVELLKIARHGAGRRVFLVEFRYLKPGSRRLKPDRRV